MALIPDITHLGAAVGTAPYALGQLMSSGVTGIVERAAIGYFLIGVVDYVHQRRRNEKALKMTKQEVKDEAKQQQLPPEVARDSPPPDPAGASADDGGRARRPTSWSRTRPTSRSRSRTTANSRRRS